MTDVKLKKKNFYFHFGIGQCYSIFGEICFVMVLLCTAGQCFAHDYWATINLIFKIRSSAYFVQNRIGTIGVAVAMLLF